MASLMPFSSLYVESRLASFSGILLHHRNMTTLVTHYNKPRGISFKEDEVKTMLSRTVFSIGRHQHPMYHAPCPLLKKDINVKLEGLPEK